MTILLPPPSKGWYYRHEPWHPTLVDNYSKTQTPVGMSLDVDINLDEAKNRAEIPGGEPKSPPPSSKSS